MALITKTKSGLKIEKWGSKYIVSKGNQTEVYGSYAAMVSGLTPRATDEKKPRKAKAKAKAKAAPKPRKARKARKARKPRATVIYQAAPAPRKPKKAAKKRVKRNAAGQAVNKHGHKRGCKCLVCSPATRKKALAARKRNAKGGAKKAAKPRKAKKGGGRSGAPFHGYNPSTRGYTFGAPETPRYRGRAHSRPAPRPRPQKAEVYRGDVSRFNGHGGLVRRHPARMPYGYLPSGRN